VPRAVKVIDDPTVSGVGDRIDRGASAVEALKSRPSATSNDENVLRSNEPD
jgi:hypothetical protein